MKGFKLNTIVIIILFSLMSCEEIIEVEDISEETIEILGPQNNSIVNQSNVNFNWTALQDSLNYRVQIAVPDFTNTQQILTDSVVTSTSFSKSLDDGNYEWRVQAFNSAYETEFTTAQFEVLDQSGFEDISGETVELLAPLNNTIIDNSTVNFNWSAIQGSESYRIQIATPDFANAQQIITDAEVTSTEFTINDLVDGNYEWRVQAFNPVYQTNYTTANFEVSIE